MTKAERQKIVKPYVEGNSFDLLLKALSMYPEADQASMLQEIYCAGWTAGSKGRSIWSPYFDELEKN